MACGGMFGPRSFTQRVALNQLAGVMIGRKSSRFTMFKKILLEVNNDADEYRYLSLVTSVGSTYDFKFADLDSSAKFIVAVSAAAAPHTSLFSGVTNIGLAKMYLLKEKIFHMAHGSLHGLRLMALRAIFNSASELLPEATHVERE